MPRMDGTGPRGMGQITGRGFGRCRSGPAQPEAEPSTVTAQESVVLPGENQETIAVQVPRFGAGRGGMPCGCGRGRVNARGHCRQ
ncbi:MAG: DUF5320 domain-containing protein [Methanoregula sp.]|nr:DUF5320 domain-containing protein [Methanoregula sp.]